MSEPCCVSFVITFVKMWVKSVGIMVSFPDEGSLLNPAGRRRLASVDGRITIGLNRAVKAAEALARRVRN